MAVPSAPGAVTFRPGVGNNPHAYFDKLTALPACTHQYAMRSAAQIDPAQTPGMTRTKHDGVHLPWLYDSKMDAALIRIDTSPVPIPGGGSTDAETRHLRVTKATDLRSIFLTFDFRYDGGWYWHGPGYITGHKNWYVYAGGTLYLQGGRASYPQGARHDARQDPPIQESVARWWLSMPAKTWVLGEPDSWRVSEEVFPKGPDYFITKDVWHRYAFFLEGTQGGGVGGTPVHLSVWLGTQQGMIQTYTRVPLYSPGPIANWNLTYDTSEQGDFSNGLMQTWIRNLAVLRGLTLEDVKGLIQAPDF